MQSIQNLGLAVVSIMTGVIVDRAGYFMLEVFFLICLCIALLAGGESPNGSVLNYCNSYDFLTEFKTVLEINSYD